MNDLSGLKNKRIVVTRASHQADSLIQAVEALGGIALKYPCIDIEPPDDPRILDAELNNLDAYDWILFTSRNTVRMIAERLHTLGSEVKWDGIKVGAIGTKTDATLSDLLDIRADFIPDNQTSADLAHDLPIYPYQKVLLPQSSLADNEIYDILLGERQADVTVITAYRTMIGQGGDDVPTLLQNNQIDAIMFTSPSTVENFVERITPITAWDIPVFCIGSTTAQAAQETGFQSVCYPDEHTIAHLIALLSKHFDEVQHDRQI